MSAQINTHTTLGGNVRLLGFNFFGGKPVGIFDLIEHFISERAQNSQRAYRGIIKEWCEHFETSYGSQHAADAIRKAENIDVIKFIKQQRQKRGLEGQKSNTLTDSTVFRKFTVLRAIYSFLVENGATERNPFSKTLITKPNTSKPEKRPYSLIPFESVKKMIELATSTQEKSILCLLFGGGLRRSEVSNLKLSDIVEEHGYAVLTLRQTKSGEEQKQGLPEWASSAVLRQKEARERKGASGEDYLILGRLGRMNDKTIYRIFKKFAELAGVRGRATPHSARATAITKLLSDGEDLRSVQEYARHATFRTTQRYDLREGLGLKAAKKLKF